MLKKDHQASVAQIASPVTELVQFDPKTASALFVISTITQDRDGDIVIPEGCLDRLGTYRANPVVLFDHGTFPLPIGLSENPLTKEFSIQVEPERILGRVYFHCETLESSQVCRLVDKQVLRAASIGFNAHKARRITEGNNPRGALIEQWELTEWSVVPIPANQEALSMALSAKWEGKALAAPIAERFKSLIKPSTKLVLPASVQSSKPNTAKVKAMPDEIIDAPEQISEEEVLPAGAQGLKTLIHGIHEAVELAQSAYGAIEHPAVIKAMDKFFGKVDASLSELQKAAASIYPEIFTESEDDGETTEDEEVVADDAETTSDETVAEDEGKADDEDEQDVSNVDNKSAKKSKVKTFKANDEELSPHLANLSDATELMDELTKSPNIPTGYKRQCKGVLPGLMSTASWLSSKAETADTVKEDMVQEEESTKEADEEEEKARKAEEEEAAKALAVISAKAEANAKKLQQLLPRR